MKVAVNRCYGGFALSRTATARMAELGSVEAIEHIEFVDDGHRDFALECAYHETSRNDETMIAVIEELGTEVASGPLSRIEIIEIPDEVSFVIRDNLGYEWVEEAHRSWGA